MQIIIITGKSINVQQISSFNGLDSSKQKEYFVFVGGEALYTFCRFFSFDIEGQSNNNKQGWGSGSGPFTQDPN